MKIPLLNAVHGVSGGPYRRAGKSSPLLWIVHISKEDTPIVCLETGLPRREDGKVLGRGVAGGRREYLAAEEGTCRLKDQ